MNIQRLTKYATKHAWKMLLLFMISVGLSWAIATSAQQSLPVRVNRWLNIRQFAGAVTCVLNGISQPARLNLRLSQINDSIQTGQNSNAVLRVDTGVGFINLSENTFLRIRELRIATDGSRITRLAITGGQARLQLRPFTHRSTLEIETPAGASGVRGTTFGVSVQPSGITGIATLEGAVLTEAQGQQVIVNAGFQNRTVPGEPPSPAVPLRDDPRLDVQFLGRRDRQTVEIRGRIDPVNLLEFNNTLLEVGETGDFTIQLPLPSNRQIQATVTTPLGRRQQYTLQVP